MWGGAQRICNAYRSPDRFAVPSSHAGEGAH